MAHHPLSSQRIKFISSFCSYFPSQSPFPKKSPSNCFYCFSKQHKFPHDITKSPENSRENPGNHKKIENPLKIMEIPENLSKSRKSPENPHVFRSLPWFQRPPAPFFAFLQGRAPRVAFHHRGCGSPPWLRPRWSRCSGQRTWLPQRR